MGSPEPGFEDFLEEKKRARNPFVPIGTFTSLSCSVNFDFRIRFIILFFFTERMGVRKVVWCWVSEMRKSMIWKF